jgi:hypothetical protein
LELAGTIDFSSAMTLARNVVKARQHEKAVTHGCWTCKGEWSSSTYH